MYTSSSFELIFSVKNYKLYCYIHVLAYIHNNIFKSVKSKVPIAILNNVVNYCCTSLSNTKIVKSFNRPH